MVSSDPEARARWAGASLEGPRGGPAPEHPCASTKTPGLVPCGRGRAVPPKPVPLSPFACKLRCDAPSAPRRRLVALPRPSIAMVTGPLRLRPCWRSRFAAGAEVAGRVAPVSPLTAKGYFELAAAAAGDSAMSKAISSLKTGDVVQFKGPVQGFQVGRNQFKSVGILARGDGIADALQVATKLLSDPRDDTEIRLVYSVR